MFQSLPTELKLNVLSHNTSAALESRLLISKECNELTRYIVQEKLKHYLQHEEELQLSVYCTSHKESGKKLFYKTLVQIGQDITTIKLLELDHKENLLVAGAAKEVPAKVKDEGYEQYHSKSHLDLLVNEEQSVVKVYLSLVLGSTLVKEVQMKLKTSGGLIGKPDGLKVQYELLKGEEEPSKGRYDYDVNVNYSLNVLETQISNIRLVDCIEQAMDKCLVVRY